MVKSSRVEEKSELDNNTSLDDVIWRHYILSELLNLGKDSDVNRRSLRAHISDSRQECFQYARYFHDCKPVAVRYQYSQSRLKAYPLRGRSGV